MAARPGLSSGFYTIDVDGAIAGLDPFGVYCDMDTDGGGWTLIGDYISNKELFAFNPAEHQLQDDAGGSMVTTPPLLDGTIHGHIAYDLVPAASTRLQCRADPMQSWFSVLTMLFQDWTPGDRGTYGSAHWGIIGGVGHARNNHYVCGMQVNPNGVYAGIGICDGPGLSGSFLNHAVSLSFNPDSATSGGGLSIGCNGVGINSGKTGSWQGRVWRR